MPLPLPTLPARYLDASRLVFVVYAVAAFIPVALMLTFLVGSLFLSGAQVTHEGRKAYEAIVPFPLFVVADWLVIAVAVICTLLVLPLAITTTVARLGRISGAINLTGGMIVADFFFAFAFPITVEPRVIGLHIIGTALGVVCMLILVVRILISGRANDKLMREGKLSDDTW